MTCCRVRQDQTVGGIGHQHGVRRGIENGFQLAAAQLHGEEQTDVRHRQRCLAGECADEAQVCIGEGPRLVVGRPERAIITVLMPQGQSDQGFGIGQVRVQYESAGS